MGELGEKPWFQGEFVGQLPFPFQMKMIEGGVEPPFVIGFCPPGNTGWPPKFGGPMGGSPPFDGKKLKSGWPPFS